MPDPSTRAPEVPRFARGWAEKPELAPLVEAFRTGNYARVRELASKLLSETTDPDTRKAIQEVRRRVDPDPLALYALAITFALLIFLAAWLYSHKI
jgi:hypothetical protein